MPELFRKVLLTPGTKFAPQGPLTLTPSRAERYARKFRQFKRKNIRFPQPWGHKLSAMPEEGTEEEMQTAHERRQFELARWNSGYIQDIEATKDGQLVMVGQVPPGYKVDSDGELVNERDGTRIAEVSGAFGNWRDGNGELHKDIIVHAALCTHPVDGGQTGFESIKTFSSPTGAVEYTFTLSSRSEAMKDDDKDKKKDKDDKDTKDSQPKDAPPIEDDIGETVPDEDAYVPEPELPPPPIETPIEPPAAPVLPAIGGDLMPKVKQLEAMLAEMQISIPPSDDVGMFINNLLVAIQVARGFGAKFTNPGDESASEQQVATANSGEQKPPTPEAPPIMMSTLTGAARELAEREQTRMRNDVARVWADNKKLGVPVAIADRESDKSATIMLSLTSSGKPKTHQRLREARLVREVVQAMRGPLDEQEQLLLKTLSTTTLNPADAAMNADKRSDPEVNEAIRAGARMASGAGRSVSQTRS